VLAVHSDYGPAAWTGRVLDATYSLLAAGGYGPGPCFDYPTDATVTAFRVAELRYPSCSFFAGLAVRQLHRRQHHHGGRCLIGREVGRMQRWQHHHRLFWSSGHRVITWQTWRLLYGAS
jgi:hypothetical protein